MHLPLPEQQTARLTPQFEQLQQAVEARRLELLHDPGGLTPEQAVVLETVGSVQGFIRAVQHVEGMEWLGEWDEEDIPPDNYFYQSDTNTDRSLSGRLFLVMTNQQAMQQLLSLWGRYVENPDGPWERGLTLWRDLFRHLRTVRRWNVHDRLAETGVLEEWKERLAQGQERVRVEVELWFRANEAARLNSQDQAEAEVRSVNGTVLQVVVIPDIQYHALLVELPIEAVAPIVDQQYTRLVRCDQVMFFRPIGQAAIRSPLNDAVFDPNLSTPMPMPSLLPVVALLDGLPLENHRLLASRLVVDDPDGWSGNYPAQERVHGTVMASLILNGDLGSSEQPLKRPIYVRPVLQPDENDWYNLSRSEVFPRHTLPIDLVHRAVRRIAEGDGAAPAAAPTVRVINLSLGDLYRPFDMVMSPWARLLDWLAWKYSILFVVSAGNCTDAIILDAPPGTISSIDVSTLERMGLQAIAMTAHKRRLLAPSEAINVLTVGASHTDASQFTNSAPTVDLFAFTPSLPSPINRIGPGMRRSIKPDILMPGGRQLYVERLGGCNGMTALQVVDTRSRPPGQKVAAPGPLPGDVSYVSFSCGTSNATALTSRMAAQLYELLQELRSEPGGDVLEDDYTSVTLKALIVHSARWEPTGTTLKTLLSSTLTAKEKTERVARLLGFGAAHPDRAFACTDERATVLGCGALGDNEANVYTLPLPPALSAYHGHRRLTITLAWLTPTHPVHRAYRSAALWFSSPGPTLKVRRCDADWQAATRGTVQHEVFVGDSAAPFADGDALSIQVNCRADAGRLTDRIPYALVVSLEVAVGVQVPVYDEIRARIRQIVQVGIPIT